jgi:biopolymer transport protein TolR
MRRIKERRLMGQINVVPYIDVMLVLLIIFMITAPMLQQGITVNLPEVEAAPLDPDLLRDNEPLVLSVDADGKFYINLGENPDEPVTDDSVLSVTAAVVRRNPKTPVVIKADEAVDFGRVALGLALLKKAGAKGIGILTEPPDSETE